MNFRRHITMVQAVLATLLWLGASACFAAQESQNQAVPSLVEVYWQSTKTVSVPGITSVIVLDSEITRAEVAYDSIQFAGLERGETVALGYINDKPVSIRVRVIQRPLLIPSPGTLRRQAEMAQGSVSSAVQVSDSAGATNIALLNGFSWSQLAGLDGRIDFEAQFEDNSFAGGHAFNFRSGTAQYHEPGLDVRLLDFNVSLVGSDPTQFVGPTAFSDFTTIRGGGLSLRRGKNEYDLFAGTSVPFYYLTLGSTRDIGGFTYRRRQTDKLVMFTTSSFINAPMNFFGLTPGRRNNVMQTGGFSYLMTKRVAMLAEGGVSNRGGMGRGELAFNGRTFTAYGLGSMSSALFPLNQMGSLLSATSTIQAGVVVKSSRRLTESLMYQHALTHVIPGITTKGSSDSINPSIWAKLSEKQDINFTYSFSRSSGGFAAQSSTGNRFDTYWHYQFAPQFSDSAQVTIGSFQDPLQLNSEDQLILRDSVFFPVKGGTLMVSVEHDRTNPSLVSKLNSELSLLSPALQSLFLSDPVSFVNSGNLPPEIRAILNAQQPAGTSVSLSGQFRLGGKLNFTPSFSASRFTTYNTGSWTPFLGYGLVYRVTPTLQLNSGLSNIWVLPDKSNQVQRTTVFSFGISKSFRAMPASLLPLRRDRVIQGRVFRDNKVNGVFSAGDNGLPGIEVRLETGETVVTDELGHYKFSGVAPGEHQVLLSLTQFREPVRMTTRNEVTVDLIRDRIAVADFGVVNFARLKGSVFNDLRFDGKKQPDAKGLGGIRLILDNGRKKWTAVTDGGGDYGVNDLPPGDYKLTIEAESVPAHYVLPNDSYRLRISPVSNVFQDIPVRALRSIAGRVFLKVAGDGGRADKNGAKLVPMAGIQITAGFGTAKTDDEGNFLLRDLPAGDLTIVLVPVRPFAEGMKAPSGTVHMSAEPVQIQGATIVISNPELVPYLLGKTAAQVREDALRAAVKSSDAGAADKSSKPPNPQAAPSADKAKAAGGGAL